MKKGFALIVAAMLMLPTVACAQSGGIAYQQVAFSNQSSAGFSPTLKNFNQGAHYLTYCNTGTGTALIQLVGSRDSNTADAVVISNVGAVQSGSCGTPIYAGGYYFAVWAQVFNVSGIISISATYSATVGPLPFPPNVGTTFPSSPLLCNHFTYTTALSSSYTAVVPFAPAPFTHTVICSIAVDGNQVAGAGAQFVIRGTSAGIFFSRSLPTGNSGFSWGQSGPVFASAFAGDVMQALVSGLTGGTVNVTVTYSYY